MTTARLPAVTIRLNATEDLAAVGHDPAAADQFSRAYRAAAAAICEGYADVVVEDVTHDAGCDAEWAKEYGLWQAVHDCVDLDDGEWVWFQGRVECARLNLRGWMVCNVPGAAAALWCPD